MAGTRVGGLKTAETNKIRHGENYYKNIGRAGGKISRGGGFAQNKDLAREAGRKGGEISRKNREF